MGRSITFQVIQQRHRRLAPGACQCLKIAVRRVFKNAGVRGEVKPATQADGSYLSEISPKKRILVLNKIDLPKRLAFTVAPESRAIEVSCRTGQGVELLKDAIKELAWSGELPAEALETMINSRHQDALLRAQDALQRALEGLRSQQTLELVALDLRIATNAIGEIVGKTTTEDLLDSIFSQFCIGK